MEKWDAMFFLSIPAIIKYDIFVSTPAKLYALYQLHVHFF